MSDRAQITHGDVTLSAFASGVADGPAILLSNSLGAGLDMWAPQRAFLERKYRVIGYDTRGHGQSSTPSAPYSFDDLTGDALAVMDHFGIATADVLGLSLGGMTALGLGLTAPRRVGKIICACARADAPEPFSQSWDDRIGAIATGGLAAIWPGTLERWLTPDYIAAHPTQVQQLENDFVATTVEGYTGCARALQGLDYKRHLGDMSRPVLFVSGAQDMGAPPAEMQSMHQATPESQYENIPDSAHIANLNKVSAFNDVLAAFLEV